MKNKGFTLIEVLVALLILAGVSVVLYQSWSGSFLAIKKSRTYSTVTLLLQKKVVEWEVKNKDKTVEELKEAENGTFGSDYPDFSWEIKLKPFSIPALVPPKSDNGGNDANAELMATIMKTMTDYFEKAVREVSITVIYTRGDKKLKYGLSTIYVDFTKEIPVGL